MDKEFLLLKPQGRCNERYIRKNFPNEYTEDKETWFEALIDNRLIRITQEEVGKDDWWNVKVKSNYLLDSNKKPMTFKTPQEAAEEVTDQIKNKMI